MSAHTRWSSPHLFILLLLGLTFPSGAFADTRSAFEEGLRFYRENNSRKAIEAWEGVLRSGQASGAVYYNLGNAYYREKEWGRSILNYERAARLMPRDPDVKTNLAEVRRQAVDRIDQPIRLVVWDWLDTLLLALSIREIAGLVGMLSAVLCIVLAAGAAAPRFFPGYRRSSANVLSMLLVLTIVWYGWRTYTDATPSAVILVEKIDVFSGPDQASKQLYSLHEGTTVGVRQSLSGWLNIELPDGRQGWVEDGCLERI